MGGVAVCTSRIPTWLLPTGACSAIARSQRVGLLLGATMIMALGDLYLTLLYAMNVGMIEANPLARLVMQYNSPAGVVVWKLSTTLLGLGILFYLRRTRLGECGSWVVFMALAALTCHWLNYSAEASNMTQEFQALAMAGGGEHWVTYGP